MKLLRDDEDAGARGIPDELAEMMGHRPAVVGDEHATLLSGYRKYLLIRQPLNPGFMCRLKINTRLTTLQRRDNQVIQVSVGQELYLYERTVSLEKVRGMLAGLGWR